MAVCDLTSDGRLSTYEESVLKLSKVSFLGKCARRENPLKLLLPTKLARLGHIPPASQAGALLAQWFLLYLFSVFTYLYTQYSVQCSVHIQSVNL